LLILRKYLAIATIVASIFLVVGCSSASQDQSASQSEGEQAQPTPQTTQTTLPPIRPTSAAELAQKKAQAKAAWTDVNADHAHQLIQADPTVQIIDVREAWMYENKHIKGAEYVPSKEFAAHFQEVIKKGTPVLVYDNEGEGAATAAAILVKNGYTHVYNLVGGMQTWSYEIEP
jgi:rhodanese-related sulfurtransferase